MVKRVRSNHGRALVGLVVLLSLAPRVRAQEGAIWGGLTICRTASTVLNVDLPNGRVVALLEPILHPDWKLTPATAMVFTASTDSHAVAAKMLGPAVKFGVVRRDGSEVLPFEYDGIRGLESGRLTVIKGEAYGVADLSGKWVVPLGVYSRILTYQENLCAVQAGGGKWGFIDPDGRMVIKPTLSLYSSAFSCGRCLIEEGSGRVVIDRTGAPVYRQPEHTSRESTYVMPFAECLARVEKNFWIENPGEEFRWDSFTEFIDATGRVVIERRKWSCGDFQEGLAAVAEGDPGHFTAGNRQYLPRPVQEGEKPIESRWGFMNKRGQVLIPMRYEEVRGFSEGRARVKVNNKWGYIDTAGHMVIEPQFLLCEDFANGVALVHDEDENISIIDRDGVVLVRTDILYPLPF